MNVLLLFVFVRFRYRMCPVYACSSYELLTGDHFFFMQVLCDLIQLLTMFAQQRICLLMLLLYQIDDQLIDLCLCFDRAGETGIATQISVVDGLQRNHVEFIALVICEKKTIRKPDIRKKKKTSLRP